MTMDWQTLFGPVVIAMIPIGLIMITPYAPWGGA